MPIALFIIIPWIVGLVSIVRYFAKKPDSFQVAESDLKSKLKLLKDPSKKEGFLLAIKYLQKEDVSAEFNSDEKRATSVLPHNVSKHETTQTKPHAHSHSGLHALDNINILLYIGAFLVVVSASIFIGFNYQLLSGLAKTIFLIIFSLLFYFSGLYLYLNTKKLKPAGITFSTIGIVLFPLCGLAYYKFVLDGSHGNLIWFATSVLTTIFYTVSIKYLKTVYLNYLTTFVFLSIFESSVSLFNVPIYYFFWVMAIFASIVAVISRNKKFNFALVQPFQITSQIIQPLSILGILYLSVEYGWMPVGINLLLASLFYMLQSELLTKENQINLSSIVSLTLFPAGLTAIAFDLKFDVFHISMIWIGLALAYLILVSAVKNEWTKNRCDSIAMLSQLFLIVAVIINSSEPINLVFSLTSVVLISAYAYYLQRQTLSLVVSHLALISIPFVYFRYALVPAMGWAIVSYLYMIISCIYVLLIDKLQKISKFTRNLMIVCFFISGILGLIFSYASADHFLILQNNILLALIFMYLSRKLGEYKYEIFSAGIFLLASWQLIELFNIDVKYFIWILTALGLVYYLVGRAGAAKESRNKLWKFAGLIVLYLAFFREITGGSRDDNLQIATVLSIAGALSYYESYLADKLILKNVSAAVIILAINFMYNFLKVEEQHIYTGTWALFFAALAHKQYLEKKFNNSNTLAIVSMGLLTVPLFFQAMQYDGQVYGIILGVESIVLLLFGMYYRYKLSVWWGTTALLIIVLNQVKDALFAMPKWLIIGLVGLLFLGGATYLLSKNNQSREEK